MDANALKEVGKFVARIAILALPLLVNYLTDSGLNEIAAAVSAILVVMDKYVHESTLTVKKGIIPF